MADTQRTRAEILTLFADNTTGEISAQDLRDFVVTIMEATEFILAGDFWREPDIAGVSADGVRGWIEPSQLIHSGCSFGNLMFKTSANTWRPYDNTDSLANGPALGVAADSYASGVSTAQILRRGLVYHSLFSASFAAAFGKPVFAASAGSVGSITQSETTFAHVIGYIENDATGIWRFDPDWSIVRGV
jgi:hypothetical protein